MGNNYILVRKEFEIIKFRIFIEKELSKLGLTSNNVDQQTLIHYRDFPIVMMTDYSFSQDFL